MSFPIIAISVAVFLIGYFMKQVIPMFIGGFLLLLGTGIMSPLDIIAGVGVLGYKAYQYWITGKRW